MLDTLQCLGNDGLGIAGPHDWGLDYLARPENQSFRMASRQPFVTRGMVGRVVYLLHRIPMEDPRAQMAGQGDPPRVIVKF